MDDIPEEQKKGKKPYGFLSQQHDDDANQQDESTPLFDNMYSSRYYAAMEGKPPFDHVSTPVMDDDEDDEDTMTLEQKAAMFDRHAREADRLSMRLMQVPAGHPEEEERIIRKSFHLMSDALAMEAVDEEEEAAEELEKEEKAKKKLIALVSLAGVALLVVVVLTFLSVQFVGPPRQPIGPYQLVERQEGIDFFSFYNFYEGRDSAGSNGYLTYVGMPEASQLGILNVTLEQDTENVYDKSQGNATEPFVYMGSSPTANGPRNSIRLEGKRRFNRGLFVIDLRHMPAGCGVWPAFWLTDEANWPINGEIDIVEGVNYQSVAKTALHSTRGCSMDDVPEYGVKTGTWDTAVGIPDAKTGVPDMTMRYATDCFVYNPKQWLNQGCVAVESQNGTLGGPLNEKGGGVYVLEWDPIFRRIRTWVFSPHSNVPNNLKDSIRTASAPDETQRIMPDPDLWDLPYGYFAIGDETDCPSHHFRNMRLVFNLAFCGSVAGNRFQLDCPKIAKKFKTCNSYIKSDPDELKEAYWKVRGVYVYEREWERAWL